MNEAARDYVRSLMGSEAYVQSGRERNKIETLFGDAKRNLGLTQLRLRGLTGARDEFLLTADHLARELGGVGSHAISFPRFSP